MQSAGNAARLRFIVVLIVRMDNREDYLVSLFFAPQGQRQAFTAVQLWFDDMMKIPRSVSEPTIGRMRVQFWRDSINGIYNVQQRLLNAVE